MKGSRWAGWMCAAALVLAACDDGGSGGGGGVSGDIGDNNPNVYLAIGDSVTGGGNGGGAPYPPRLATLTGKVVINEGRDSESTGKAAGRVAGLLAANKPAALLIDLGAVDLIESRGINTAVANLRSIIRAAKANKTIPVIATLTPMSGSHSLWADGARQLSARIRSIASEEGARLVDLESEFGSGNGLILGDGLHPNDTGNQLMAEAFKDRL